MPFPKNRKIMIYKKLFDLIVEFFNQYEKKNWILSFGIDDGKLLQCIATVRHTSKYCKPFSVQNNQQQLFLIRKAKILTYFWINLFFSYFLQNLSFFLPNLRCMKIFYSMFYQAHLGCYEKNNQLFFDFIYLYLNKTWKN